MISRRSFLRGILVAGTAPAFVKAFSLMRVKPIETIEAVEPLHILNIVGSRTGRISSHHLPWHQMASRCHRESEKQRILFDMMREKQVVIVPSDVWYQQLREKLGDATSKVVRLDG